MESKGELKEINIKNRKCYCFDDTMRVCDITFNDILLNQKSYKNTLIYDVSYKTILVEKPSHIRFDKIDGFIKVHDGLRYLVLIINLQESELIHIILYI